jgi:hypothetical protein
MNNRTLFLGVAALAVAFPMLAVASPVEIRNRFEDGNPIVAAEFNENFDAIAEAINDNDARIAALEAATAGGGVPAGTIAFFATADGAGAGGCPDGWGEYADLRGRVPLALPENGELLTTVGTAFIDDGEANMISQVVAHTHSATLSGTADDLNSGHSHTLTNGAHNNHAIEDDGIHDHDIAVNTGGFGTSTVIGGTLAGTPDDTATPIRNDGLHGHAFSPANGVLGGHSHTVTGGAHEHSVSVSGTTGGVSMNGANSVDVTMPYMQLLACEKL